MKPFFKFLLAVFGIALVVLLTPFTTHVVPRVEISLTDESGAPLAAIRASELWNHALLETSTNVLATSDAAGRIMFEEHRVVGSIASRAAAFLRRFRLMHDPSKTWATVLVFLNKKYEVISPPMPHCEDIMIALDPAAVNFTQRYVLRRKPEVTQ